MSTVAWLIVFFLILLAISVLVYVLVIKAFYWGDKREPPVKKK
jgi:NADH:ubiquinone oxidoreductase subunit 2 (subunit N)